MNTKYFKLISAAVTILLSTAFAAYAQQRTPGGIAEPNRLEFWLAADNPRGDGTQYNNNQGINANSAFGWADLSGNANRNFVRAGGPANRVRYIYNGTAVRQTFNFHPAFSWYPVGNTDDLRLRSQSEFATTTANSYYVFIVSTAQRGGVERTLFNFFQSGNPSNTLRAGVGVGNTRTAAANNNTNIRGNYVQVGFNPSNSTNDSWTPAAPAAYFGRANSGDPVMGIVTVSVANDNTVRAWRNGVIATPDGNSGNFRWNVNGTPQLGNISGNRLPHNGNIQEVIVISRPGNAHITDSDLQRIYSYLYVKYAYSQTANNAEVAGDAYLNSDGNPIWNRGGVNAGFQNFVIGVARDDKTRLNQVQSRHSNLSLAGSQILTLFKGNAVETLNNINSTAFAQDKTYIMFGSNNGSITASIDYLYNDGTEFANGRSDGRVNFRTQLTYKAQVSIAGAPAQLQPVNIHINSTRPRFVLVSSLADFTPGANTRFYPLTNGVANIEISNGDYVSFAGFAPTPGGVTSHSHLDLWFDGNGINQTTIGANSNVNATPLGGTMTLQRNGSVDNITVQNSRFNFHRELNMGTNAQLIVPGSYETPNSPATGYYTFMVSENREPGILLTYNCQSCANDGNQRLAANRSLRWDAAGTIGVRWSDANTAAVLNNPLALNVSGNNRFAIASLNVWNNGSAANASTMSVAVNGQITNRAIAGSASPGGRQLTIGHGNSAATACNRSGINNQFAGTIQEIIVMRGTSLMLEEDVRRIHTYLAIKYGISLQDGNYISTDGKIVWLRENDGFNNHIIGIARDDNTGLYQKQAKSASAPNFMTVYVGNAITTLNSDNNGVIADKQYLMIGSDNNAPFSNTPRFTVHYDTDYAEGGQVLSEIDGEDITTLNIFSPIYKTQLSGADAMTVKIRLTSRDYRHAFVSKSPNFAVAETKLVNINRGDTELTFNSEYRYFTFGGFSPGPGGVTRGLAMWLRSDDEASMDIINRPSTDTFLGGYPEFIPPAQRDSVPTVSVWRDVMRGHTYSMAATGTSADRATRSPVHRLNNPVMNFQHSVRFWRVGGTNDNNAGDAAYFGNASGIFPGDGRREHTTMMVANNNFSANDATNILYFGSASTANNVTGPSYGINRLASPNQRSAGGRLRGSTASGEAYPPVARGEQTLFNAGATTILGYYLPQSQTSGDNWMYFRFNGIEESARYQGTTAAAGFNLGNPSTLGAGYRKARTIQGSIAEVIIFDRMLDDNDKHRVESYLALKYGITLRPNTAFNTNVNHPSLPPVANRNNTGYFDYKLSSDDPNNPADKLWPAQWAFENPTAENAKFVRFYNNIAAVVRDDAARLEQRQAHSTNVGSILYMGLAGAKLTDAGDQLGEFAGNNEALIWGGTAGETSNHTGRPYGGPTLPELPPQGRGILGRGGEECGIFDFKFERIWYVHKRSRNNRDVPMIVAIRNNGGLSFGDFTITEDVVTNNYYSKINESNEFVLLVATSEQKMRDGEYKYVIPMSFVRNPTGTGNSFQANYNFTEEDTYVSFGYKSNLKGCGSSTVEFSGTKTFRWDQYTSRTNRNRNYVAAVPAGGATAAVNLGDDVNVTTRVTYAANVRATRGYPRMVNSPQRGSLRLQRRGAQLGTASEVTVTINLGDNPVIPNFMIAGLAANGRAFEEVEITGFCTGGAGPFRPTLSYVGTPRSARYTINGNRATANRRGNVGVNNRNGQLRVAFEDGVTQIVIRYRATNRAVSSTQAIWITPIIMRAAPPPPPIVDGLSFVSQVAQSEITTCETPEYTFIIENVTCDAKTLKFVSKLPEGLVWELLSLDAYNAEENDGISINAYAGEPLLEIEGLVIPPTTKVRLTATAAFRDGAAGGRYENQAVITYIKDDGSEGQLASVDRQTLAPMTYFEAEERVQLEKATILITTNRTTYREKAVVEYTVSITNPNEDITDSFMEFAFNDGFELVGGSAAVRITSDGDSPHNIVVVQDDDEPRFTLAGACFISTTCPETTPEGFTFGSGETITIKFRLKAPDYVECEDDCPLVNGLPAEDAVVPLELEYELSTGMDDPCISQSLSNLNGSKLIPYNRTQHIISNRHSTRNLRR